MKQFSSLLILLICCFSCAPNEKTYYLPELGLFLHEKEGSDYVLLMISKNYSDFHNSSFSDFDYVKIPKGHDPISYYTFFIHKENRDTLWFKHGVDINSIKIHMKEIPSYQPWMDNYEQRLYPLKDYYSFQVYWDGHDYSIHIQNNAGKIIRTQ